MTGADRYADTEPGVANLQGASAAGRAAQAGSWTNILPLKEADT